MSGFGSFFAFVLYFICLIGFGIYLLMLLGQFVRAQTRTAEALTVIARKLKDHSEL